MGGRLKYKPEYGVNLRLPAYEIPPNQALLMQNIDFTHEEGFEQIKGSQKYHDVSIGTRAATCIPTYYNNETNVAQVLACLDDKILRRKPGSNSFETLFTGLRPNLIENYVNIQNKMYLAHPDGLLEYDGIKVFSLVDGVKLIDIIFADEVNRGFGISADFPNTLFYTDDVSTMGGVPIVWNAINLKYYTPTEGDVIEKIGFSRGRLILFLTNSIWIEYVNGAPQNWRAEKAPTQIGFIAKRTIKKVGAEFWGLGYSPSQGRGLYAFNGETSRYLSLDAEPFLERINENLIQQSCAEYVDDIYKLSVPIDGSLENNYTLHFDTLLNNEDTSLPNFYGPHSYGFETSAVLNTRQFKGEHLFAKKYQGGSWIFKTSTNRTFYATGMTDDGEPIETIMLSGILSEDKIGGSFYDRTWMKRYENFFNSFPPGGSWDFNIDILKDDLNETYRSFKQWMDSKSTGVASINLDQTPINLETIASRPMPASILARALQFKIYNTISNRKFAWQSITYDAKPVRKIRMLERVQIP